jgi:hypothetical protein
MSFGTQRGLSTHERHAHPAVRNVKRRGTDPPEKGWTFEEIALLRELCETYKDHRYPNKKISEVLTNKTIDQIKYQRKKLRLTGEDPHPQEAVLVTEGGCDLVDPGNARPEVSGISENDFSEWMLQLEQAIETQAEVPPVLRWEYLQLVKIWATFKNDREALIQNVNEFIETKLYGAIKHIKKDLAKSSQTKKNINKNSKTKSRKGRNKRKRYSYARCQELFLENPKRLADAVINNDQALLQPAREPPDAAEVRRLYQDLWGRAGQSRSRKTIF